MKVDQTALDMITGDMAKAVAAERERCAKIAKKVLNGEGYEETADLVADAIMAQTVAPEDRDDGYATHEE